MRTVNAQELEKALIQSHTSRMLAVHQMATATLAGCTLAMRVISADVLDRDARAEAISYHSYRGRLMPDTDVHLVPGEATSTHMRALAPRACVQRVYVPATVAMPRVSITACTLGLRVFALFVSCLT